LIKTVKNLLFKLAPRKMAVIQSIRSRRRSHKLIKEWGILDLNRKLKAGLGKRIQAGPFMGAELPEDAFLEHVGPFLLGTYESELNEIWPTLLGKTYSQVIDIGSKFGYYAVGLALRYPEIDIVAFDIDPWARGATLAMIKDNGVKNARVDGFCDSKWVRKNLKPRALLICDCEGYESELFGQDLGDNIGTLTAVIETHDQLVPDASSRIRNTFQQTHDLIEISKAGAVVAQTGLSFLSADEMSAAVREIREVQRWIVCIPKSKLNDA
jgi:hypothetical protein